MDKLQQEEIEKIELRSEEFNEIVSMVPHWYEQWGITVVFSFMLLILVGCWFFKYPDMVTVRVDITIDNPPASVMAKATGKIEKIFVADNAQVRKDSILALLENPADFNEVLTMKGGIDSIGKLVKNPYPTLPEIVGNYTKLGDLQTPYSLFLKQYNDYKNFIYLDYHYKKIQTINKEIQQQQKYLLKLRNRANNTNEQLALTKKQFVRDSLLFKQNVIAASDFEKSQSLFLQSKNTYESVNSELLTTDMQVTRLQQSILDLESQKLEQTSQQQNVLKESLAVLSAKVQEWEKLYILKAPLDGKVTFTRFWATNQDIKTGDIVFTVVPNGSNNFIAKLQLPIQSSGKVKTGQKVIIKLDDYPYMEYGFIRGSINKISLVSSNDFYYAEVNLPQKLITTYGKDISAKKELRGSGEIIVRDERLLYKFLLPIRTILNKNEIE
jgi:HlyD family secretion protein